MIGKLGSRLNRLELIGWAAVSFPIAIWMGHLIYSAAMVEVACTHGLVWAINLGTVVAGLWVLGHLLSAIYVVRRAPDGATTTAGPIEQLRFLGFLGITSALFNLALIIGEGTYAIFLSPCHG